MGTNTSSYAERSGYLLAIATMVAGLLSSQTHGQSSGDSVFDRRGKSGVPWRAESPHALRVESKDDTLRYVRFLDLTSEGPRSETIHSIASPLTTCNCAVRLDAHRQVLFAGTSATGTGMVVLVAVNEDELRIVETLTLEGRGCDSVEYSAEWQRLFVADPIRQELLTAPWRPDQPLPREWEVIADGERVPALRRSAQFNMPSDVRAANGALIVGYWPGLPAGSSAWELRPAAVGAGRQSWSIVERQSPLLGDLREQALAVRLQVLEKISVDGPIVVVSKVAGRISLQGPQFEQALSIGDVVAGERTELRLPPGRRLTAGEEYSLTLHDEQHPRPQRLSFVPLWRSGHARSGSGVEFLEPDLMARWATLGSWRFGARCRYRVESAAEPDHPRRVLVLVAKVRSGESTPVHTASSSTILAADRILVLPESGVSAERPIGTAAVIPLPDDSFDVGDVVAVQFLCWTPSQPERGVATTEIVALPVKPGVPSSRVDSQLREAAERTWRESGIVTRAGVQNLLVEIRRALER
ncbi:MAG: hypothetical protein AB7I19_06075 [Planctomycetota bacterium]